MKWYEDERSGIPDEQEEEHLVPRHKHRGRSDRDDTRRRRGHSQAELDAPLERLLDERGRHELELHDLYEIAQDAVGRVQQANERQKRHRLERDGHDARLEEALEHLQLLHRPLLAVGSQFELESLHVHRVDRYSALK